MGEQGVVTAARHRAAGAGGGRRVFAAVAVCLAVLVPALPAGAVAGSVAKDPGPASAGSLRLAGQASLASGGCPKAKRPPDSRIRTRALSPFVQYVNRSRFVSGRQDPLERSLVTFSVRPLYHRAQFAR